MLVLVLLDLDPVRVVGADLVQGHDVDEDQGRDQEGQQEMEGKEAIEGGVGDNVVAADPDREVLADAGDGREEVDDDLGAPVGHLAPGQQVAEEGRRHHGQVDDDTDDPQQFPGLAVGAVHQGPEHVEIDDDEEGRGAGGVHVAHQPAPVHITHDVFDGGEGIRRRGLVVHGQPDPGQNLDDQDQHGQGTKEVPEVEVLGGIVLGKMLIPHLGQGEALVNPAEETRGCNFIAHQAAPPSSPTKMTVSDTNLCLGMTRFVGAGTPL